MQKRKSQILKIFLLMALLGPIVWKIYPYLRDLPLGSEQPRLVAIDLATGHVKWSTPFPGQDKFFYNAPIALSRDRILATQFLRGRDEGSQCSWVEFDRNSGQIVWRQSLKELGLEGCPAPHIPAVAQNGQLYTFWRRSINYGDRSEQAIIAMDFATHKVKWTAPIQMRWHDESREKGLILSAGKLIAGIADDNQKDNGTEIKAFNSQTGDVIWQEQLAGSLTPRYDRSPFLSDGNLIIFGTDGTKNLASRWRSHSIQSGKAISTYDKPSEKPGSQIIWDILPKVDRIYALLANVQSEKDVSFSIASITLNQGKFMIENQSLNFQPLDSGCTRLLNSNENAFLLQCQKKSGDQQLVALDGQTYKQKWQVAVTGSFSKVTIANSGKHILLSESDRIRLIAASNGKTQWSLPIPDSPNLTIDGDTLFVITSLPRQKL
jgi:outer membrane protein assembly factor BamB